MTITKTLPVEYNIDENFRATASWPVRVFYLYLSLMAARPKYYFAWTLGKCGKKLLCIEFHLRCCTNCVLKRDSALLRPHENIVRCKYYEALSKMLNDVSFL